MIFSDLTSVPIAHLHQCFLKAFADYAVPMQIDEQTFEQKLLSESFDASCSVGCFDTEHQLVGFILHGVRTQEGKKHFYNCGTGVVPTYRGQKLTQRMYECFFKQNKLHTTDNVVLEVLQNNVPAIKSYQAVGFEITRNFLVYKRVQNREIAITSTIESVSLREITPWKLDEATQPSWQNTFETLQNIEQLQCIVCKKDNQNLGFAIFHSELSKVYQIYVFPHFRRKSMGSQMLSYIQKLTQRPLVLVNVPQQPIFQSFFETNGFEKTLGQYEMKKNLSKS